ncbi:RNA polymerase sigma-70 factor [Chitinophaga sp. 22321]|uniref:RNA polymerase sigma-70 factor n=1 Tax=Chitinophaga hostae TaxID=2831022 RepID=A0ABS5J1C6_9BACT|nr:RNA polymerase sigma-70 factor [Chitinophaga hostae]MBS0028242.1 RNA polymerase sigma-70 factor [Chitinophaga hostae]
MNKLLSENSDLNSIKHGDSKAFDAFYLEYFDRIFVLLLFFSKSREVAQDLAQETFARVWETRASLNPENLLKSYTRRIAKNLLQDHFRKLAVRNKHEKNLATGESAGNRTMDRVLDRELQNLLEEAVNSLPQDKQVIFRMSRYQHLSYAEIAAALNTTPKAVERHMARALQYLRVHLSEKAGYQLPVCLLLCTALSII